MKLRVLVLIVLLGIAGCTVAPPVVESHHASFTGNTANSGIISSDQYGFIVTQHFLDRHHINTKDATGVGDNWRITAETMDKAVAQDATARQPKS